MTDRHIAYIVTLTEGVDVETVRDQLMCMHRAAACVPLGDGDAEEQAGTVLACREQMDDLYVLRRQQRERLGRST